jgi:hypothetical protein
VPPAVLLREPAASPRASVMDEPRSQERGRLVLRDRFLLDLLLVVREEGWTRSSSHPDGNFDCPFIAFVVVGA